MCKPEKRCMGFVITMNGLQSCVRKTNSNPNVLYWKQVHNSYNDSGTFARKNWHTKRCKIWRFIFVQTKIWKTTKLFYLTSAKTLNKHMHAETWFIFPQTVLTNHTSTKMFFKKWQILFSIKFHKRQIVSIVKYRALMRLSVSWTMWSTIGFLVYLVLSPSTYLLLYYNVIKFNISAHHDYEVTW